MNGAKNSARMRHASGSVVENEGELAPRFSSDLRQIPRSALFDIEVHAACQLLHSGGGVR